MKKLLFVLPLVFFIITSCGKRVDEMSNEMYVGTWNWKSTDNGIGGVVETPESTGIIRKLTFTENYQYSVTENDVVKNEGSYTLQKGVSNTDHVEKMYVVFSNNGEKIVLRIDSSNLALGDDDTNGLIYYYVK